VTNKSDSKRQSLIQGSVTRMAVSVIFEFACNPINYYQWIVLQVFLETLLTYILRVRIDYNCIINLQV